MRPPGTHVGPVVPRVGEAARERPILFSAPMVRALLAGTKTQTRRIMKSQPTDYAGAKTPPPSLREPRHAAPYFDAYNHGPQWCWWDQYDRQGPDWIKCPYGVPGDVLWVRESFTTRNDGSRANPRLVPMYAADFAGFDKPDRDWGWSPSIHMPRWASRISLRITDVRVERLNEIDDSDSMAEGVGLCADGGFEVPDMGDDVSPICCQPTARQAYRCLWERINGPGSWDANPWVWCVAFEVARERSDTGHRDRPDEQVPGNTPDQDQRP